MRGTSLKVCMAIMLSAGLFTGCEWTGSDGESSWSGSYDAMNFSGVYRVSSISADSSGDASSEISATESIGTLAANQLNYSGKLSNAGVVAGSLVINAGGYTYTDNGSGVLVGNNASTAGTGTIAYSSGAWTLNLKSPSTGAIKATYSYTGTVSGDSTGVSISYVNVQQNGQNLTMILSNGIAMSGKFGKVNQGGSTEGSAASFNATFEVSSSGNKMVGTLDSTSGSRVLDGTWISGNMTYDVRATAGSGNAN